MTLTFTPADISVKDFNGGEFSARSAVKSILDRLLNVAYPGVPVELRPPVLITTHTYKGCLELNVAMPCCVFRDNEEVRSFNPGASKANQCGGSS